MDLDKLYKNALDAQDSKFKGAQNTKGSHIINLDMVFETFLMKNIDFQFKMSLTCNT